LQKLAFDVFARLLSGFFVWLNWNLFVFVTFLIILDVFVSCMKAGDQENLTDNENC
jgi:hypothetical protein